MLQKTFLQREDVRFEYVTDPARALDILAWAREQDYVALDFETTALTPDCGCVRISTIWRGDEGYVLDHFFCGHFVDLVDEYAGPTWLVKNVKFEGKWFLEYIDDPLSIDLLDINYVRAGLMGGRGMSLAMMVKEAFGVDMSKQEQMSDWSKRALTDKQKSYAAYDGYVTWEVFIYWRQQMTDEHMTGARVINDAWRGTLEMQETGLFIDEKLHAKNIKVWKTKQQTALRYFQRYTPKSIIDNPNSNRQMSNFLKQELPSEILNAWPSTDKTDDLKMDREACRQAAFRLPAPMNRWFGAFIVMRYWNKYLSTYGDTLLTKQQLAGKVTSNFNIAAAVTTRYSSSAVNLQNIPRKVYIRKAFISPSKGIKMVLADYSGIEVRVLAEISDDAQLREDCIFGDVHGSNAANINNIDEDLFFEVIENKKHRHYLKFKEMRSKAKVFTFRLLYGAGIPTLAISLRVGDEEAEEAVGKWAERYSNAYNYRFKMQKMMNNDGFMPLASGGKIFVPKWDRSLPVAANYPVQGSAASVMYRAVTRVYEGFCENDIEAWMAATVHDELLNYAKDSCAQQAHDIMVDGMEKAWLDIFPNTLTDNLIDSAIGTAWSDKP